MSGYATLNMPLGGACSKEAFFVVSALAQSGHNRFPLAKKDVIIFVLLLNGLFLRLPTACSLVLGIAYYFVHWDADTGATIDADYPAGKPI